MKPIYLSLLVLSFASIAHAGNLVTGQALDFTSSDFSSSNSASLPFVINSVNSSSDTDVYAVQNLSLEGDGRLDVEFGGSPLENSVTYQAITPSNYLIQSFTFALNDLTLAGGAGGGNVVNLQYSTNGTTFTNFYSYDNLDSSETSPYITLSNQTYNVTVADPSNTLYVRLDEVANGTSNSYFALWSNDSTGVGGSSPNSYLDVTVQAAPEPSTFVLFGAGACALIFATRRRLSTKSV